MLATPSLRQAKITVILLLVSMTLLLLRNNLIPLHQSSNFVRSLSNYSRSSTIFFGIPACIFLLIFTAAGVSANDISVSVLLLEASSVICKDSNHSNNVLISFVLLELVLVLLYRLSYMCFILDR